MQEFDVHDWQSRCSIIESEEAHEGHMLENVC